MNAKPPQFEIAHDAMALTGESPLWDPDRKILWWIDIQGQRLLGYIEAAGEHVAIPLPSMPGLVALSRDGRLIAGLEDGLWTVEPETRSMQRAVEVEADDSRTRINDGKPDRDGRLWFGTMDKTGSGAAIGSLYRLDPGQRVVKIRSAVSIPNAIAISPDGNIFYFTDSLTQKILAHPIDRETGDLGEPEIFARYEAEEKPDGACVDADGGLWIAVISGSRIDRFHANGQFDRSFPVPVSRPTMPMFGGADLRKLFVTSQRRFLNAEELARQPAAGSLLMADVGFAGLLPNRVHL